MDYIYTLSLVFLSLFLFLSFPSVIAILPPTICGVVLGLSARCVGSVIDPPPPDLQEKLLCGALCIVFDSESIGFAGALARVFERVYIYVGVSDERFVCHVCTFAFGVFSIELEYLIHNREV